MKYGRFLVLFLLSTFMLPSAYSDISDAELQRTPYASLKRRIDRLRDQAAKEKNKKRKEKISDELQTAENQCKRMIAVRRSQLDRQEQTLRLKLDQLVKSGYATKEAKAQYQKIIDQVVADKAKLGDIEKKIGFSAPAKTPAAPAAAAKK